MQTSGPIMITKKKNATIITLFRSITVCSTTNSILQNILHIQYAYEEYSTKYCQSRETLLWI